MRAVLLLRRLDNFVDGVGEEGTVADQEEDQGQFAEPGKPLFDHTLVLLILLCMVKYFTCMCEKWYIST